VTIGEHNFLQAELVALGKLISRMPEANVIDRMSLVARKKEVETALSNLKTPYYEPVRSRLIFRGKPTVKSRGIFADFAASALDKFAFMVAAIGAGQTTQLGSRGIIPNREEYQLMITGTTTGSFGFEIEEAPDDKPKRSPEFSPVKAAIDKANLILELSAGSSDDDLAEAIADESPRAIEAIRAFLEVMENNEAAFALELDSNSLKPPQFINVEQTKRTRERLMPENIREGDWEISGAFQGILPTRRTFEFLIKEHNEVIVGKIGPEIEDPSEINRIIEKPTKISVHTKQVGTSRPRYLLNRYEEITE
jgi:hypothetical protein